MVCAQACAIAVITSPIARGRNLPKSAHYVPVGQHHSSASNSVLASCKSAVSKPSVNQL